MSDLPPGWEWTTLGEIAEIQGGIQKQGKRRPIRNSFPFLRVANVARGKLHLADVHEIELFEGELERYRLQFGDLLVVEGNGSLDQLGRAAMWRGQVSNCVHQNHLIRARPGRGVDPTYLVHVWNSDLVARQLGQVGASTSGLHTLSVGKLRPIRIPMAPHAEQRRIVAALEDHLSRLDAGSALLVSNSRRLRGLADQLTADALSGTRVEVSNAAADPLDVGLQDGELPRLPAHWRWKRLHEIADVVGGVTKDAKRQSDTDLPEVPYLRVANVQRGRLDLSTVSTIRVPARKVEELALQPGDVLLNEGGDRDKLARGWIWEGQLPLCIHQNHVFRARIRDGVLDPRILAWHANGFGQRWAAANGKQSVNLASISLSKIRQMPVPVPPESEQAAVVETIEASTAAVSRLEGSIMAGRIQGNRLRRSLLVDAFTGRLVPQDPTDEPASVLLDHIRAERAASAVPKRTRQNRRPDPAQEILS